MMQLEGFKNIAGEDPTLFPNSFAWSLNIGT